MQQRSKEKELFRASGIWFNNSTNNNPKTNFFTTIFLLFYTITKNIDNHAAKNLVLPQKSVF